ncbi:Tao3p [Nakaseomyces bracarensis]|uniref:Tao3p n=1 Tax=Nakaseomyces bracarensis TaxID=273131 RepID=UPI0038714F38
MNTAFTFPPQGDGGNNTTDNNDDNINVYDGAIELPNVSNVEYVANGVESINLQQQLQRQQQAVPTTMNPLHINTKMAPGITANQDMPVIAIPSPIDIPEDFIKTKQNSSRLQNEIFNQNHVITPEHQQPLHEIQPEQLQSEQTVQQQQIQQQQVLLASGQQSQFPQIGIQVKTIADEGVNGVPNNVSPTESNKNDAFVLNLRQQMATDWKSPSEYALHILFTKFIRHAENKLNLCLQQPLAIEPPIVEILGVGVDPVFDKVISSLGHVAKNKPKPVIDAMMFWRKTKSEAAVNANSDLERLLKDYEVEQTRLTRNVPSRNVSQRKGGDLLKRKNTNSTITSTSSFTFSHKRNKSSKSSLGSKIQDNPHLQNMELAIENCREAVFHAERKSLASIYILCRVLIEIVKQSSDEDKYINDKLEEIVFTQLKTTDPLSISTSIMKSSNWNSFAELLGYMSEKRFLSVSDRFIADLEKLPEYVSPDMEPNVHLLILGMRYLRLKNYPLERFEESADFLKSLSKFYSKSTNISISLAYTEVINQLLLPLAGLITAEVNHPTWVEAMSSLLDSSSKLLSDSKYWANGFKLTVSILCVSPPELFSNRWLTLMENNASRIRTKNHSERVIFAVALSRLVWVYLYRCPETLNNTMRTLEKLLRMYLNTKKKENWLTPDFDLLNPLVDVLVSVGYAHPNFIMEHAVLSLFRQSFNGSSLDDVNFEKLLLALNTYKGLLSTNSRPGFPESDYRIYKPNLDSIYVDQGKESLVQNHKEVCSYIHKLFILLDSRIGSEVWSPENLHTKSASSSFGPFTFNFSNDNYDYTLKNTEVQLFATVIEVMPGCLSVSSDIPYKSTIEILSRNAVHANATIANRCREAFRSLASKKNPYTLITWFAKYSFDFDERMQSNYNMAYLSSMEYYKLLELYVELLECWLDAFQSSNKEKAKKGIGLDGIRLMAEDDDPNGSYDEVAEETKRLEWKNTITVIEEVEGNGLFFLCSYEAHVRALGVRILKIISKFDEAMIAKTVKLSSNNHVRTVSNHFAADSGTRLIDILNNCNVSAILNPNSVSLSAVEKTRFGKLNYKHKRGVLIKLAESDYGVDAALWQRAFPPLLAHIFKLCPVTMALCRSIVCIRLVQIHEIILKVANNPEYKPEGMLVETVINQWRLYLIAACTFLTSTTDQKLHIPLPTGTQHGRKKSQQIFTVQHQKIKSVKSIFKMVLPLLNARHAMVRDAIIVGLSSMNVNIYRTYIESIDEFLTSWKEQSSKNAIRIEMFHILTILSSFLFEPIILEDRWILERIAEYIKQTKKFLENDYVQTSFAFQSLRNHFATLLLNFYKSAHRLPSFDKLFPFQGRTSSFNYLKEWCGYGEFAYIAEERYNYMVKKADNSRDKTAILTGIEFQRKRLEKTILEAMVALCEDPIVKTMDEIPGLPVVISFDTVGLLSWIGSLFNSGSDTIRSLGVEALENLLENNRENSKLFKEVANQCVSYHNDPSVSFLYYTTLCKAVLKLENLILEEDELVSLGLYGLVSDNEMIRTYAADLLSVVETKLHNSTYIKVFKERLSNSSKTVYKATAQEISSIFSDLLSQDLCLRIFSTLVRILELFQFEIKRDILVLMVPWVHKFTLKSLDEIDTYMVLNNLFYITIDLNDTFPKEVEQLWISLGKGNAFQNTHVSLEYIITSSISYCNPTFVEYASDVVLYLANVPGGIGLMDTLLQNLKPKLIVPSHAELSVPPTNNNKYVFVGDIVSRLNYHGKSVMFSKTQLTVIFLVNLLNSPLDSVKAHLPSLLHVSMCLLDHYIPIVKKSASHLLCNLIFIFSPTHEKTDATVAILGNESKLWTYDNLVRDKKGARSPKIMDQLIRNLVEIFSSVEEIQVDWQRVSLKWATACSVRHVACRSFQMFRSLLTFLDQEMFRDILHRLSNTVSDENNDIQGFAMQILMTLNAITAELDPTVLISFPQLFWSITACLSSIHELEFIEVLSCFSKFVSKIDLDSPDTVQCLVATFPSNWEGKFDGLQQIIMNGLRSSTSLDITWKFLDKLNLLKDSRIIANTDTRLLFALIANLPRFLEAMDTKNYASVEGAAVSMVALSEAYQQPSLSRLINSLVKDKFRSKRDFMSQVVSFISRNYFPEYSAQTLVFLLGLLLNKVGWVKVQTMEILKYVFPLLDMNRPEFLGVGADLISPLLRLLLTEYETAALEVLDCVPNVLGSKMDKDVLRTTMGNKNLKNNTNLTTTLFGIPEDSGWSIPMPSMTAATTRHNVHSVYMSCLPENIQEGTENEIDNELDAVIEFHADGDYGLGRMETNDSASVVEEKDPSLSHMWMQLDNLDNFFAQDNVQNTTNDISAWR